MQWSFSRSFSLAHLKRVAAPFLTRTSFASLVAGLLEEGSGPGVIGKTAATRGPVGKLTRAESGPRAGVWRPLI